MFSRRSQPQMTPSDRVRKLWTAFEQWHTEQTVRIEQQVATALRELDQKWRDTPSKKRSSKKDHEEQKKTKRQQIKKTFDGNMVREEWAKRLEKAGLQADDWTDMTEVEQRKVEKILGADLDLSVMEVEQIPAVQSIPSTPSTSSGALFAPPMTSDSRSGSMSDNSNYAFVPPNSFNMKAVEEDEPWMQVVQKPRSDDEISLDASTASSWGFHATDGPAYLSWSSEASRSSTQTSQASSPEHASKFLSPDVKQHSLLSAAAKRLVAGTERPSRSEIKPSPPELSHSRLFRSESASSLLESPAPQPISLVEEPHGRATSRSRGHYIGPHLSDPHEVTDEEAEFQKFKLEIRIQKIREFHEEAAQADIELTLEIEEARGMKKSSKEYETKAVEVHEQKMLQLRKSKEEERKAIVEAERHKRLAAMHAREVRRSDDRAFEEIPPSVAAQFLKGLKDMDGSADGGMSDTGTIRQQQRRGRKPSLLTDWTTGGGDTPTPTTARVSAWAAQSSHLSQSQPVDIFGEAPSLKREPADLSTPAKKPSSDTTPHAVDITPTSKTSKKSEPSTTTKVLDAPPKTVEKVEAKSAPPPTSKGKKKKGKASITQVQSEVSSSETSSTPATKTKLGPSALSSSSVGPPEPPLATKPTKAALAAKSKLEPASSKPKPEEAFASGSRIAASSSAWLSPPVADPSPALSPSTSSSSTWSAWSSASASTSDTAPNGQELWTPANDSQNRPVWPSAYNKATNNVQAEKPVEDRPMWPSNYRRMTDTPQIEKPTEERPVWPSMNRKVTETPQPAHDGQERPVWPSAYKKTADAPQMEKSVSAASSSQYQQAQAPLSAAETKRLRKASEAKQTVEVISAKAAGKRAESSQVTGSSSILKKAGSKSGTTKSSKSSKKKQVTIEEVSDEDKEEPVPGSVERLPSDSRYIMEPKPVQPPTQFSQIFEYGEPEVPSQQNHEPQRWVPTERNRQPSNDIWMPGGFDDDAGSRSKAEPHWSHSASGMNIPWTPSATRSSGSSRRTYGPEPGKDLFLSALDSLEEMLTEDERERPRSYEREGDNLGRLLSGVGKGLERSEKNGDGGEALWHAIASYGQRGNAASAW